MSIVHRPRGATLSGINDGQPRNEHVEEIVRQQLREIDPLLDIKWFPTLGGRYALTCRWGSEDKRWEMYQSGEIGSCEDILGWFVDPAADGSLTNGTLPPVDPLLLMDRVREFLGKMDNTRSTFRERMLKTVEANKRRQAKLADEVNEPAKAAIRHYSKLHVGEPIVHLGSGTRESIQVRED